LAAESVVARHQLLILKRGPNVPPTCALLIGSSPLCAPFCARRALCVLPSF